VNEFTEDIKNVCPRLAKGFQQQKPLLGMKMVGGKRKN
jgi:hypothetical protein